jgi:hypothetical protein
MAPPAWQNFAPFPVCLRAAKELGFKLLQRILEFDHKYEMAEFFSPTGRDGCASSQRG